MVETIIEKSRKIKDLGCGLDIFVSLDGKEKSHDRMRCKKGTFKKAVETIERLKKEKNIGVTVCATLTNENKDDIEWLSDFVLNKLKIPFYCDPVRGNPRVPSTMPPKLEKKFLKLHEYPFGNYVMKRKFEALEGKFRFKCLAGNYIGVVYSDGDVSICEFIKPFGNLKESNFNFMNLWKKRPTTPTVCACSHGCFITPSLYYSLNYIKNRNNKNLLL